jgi:hypothetical protein
LGGLDDGTVIFLLRRRHSAIAWLIVVKLPAPNLLRIAAKSDVRLRRPVRPLLSRSLLVRHGHVKFPLLYVVVSYTLLQHTSEKYGPDAVRAAKGVTADLPQSRPAAALPVGKKGRGRDEVPWVKEAFETDLARKREYPVMTTTITATAATAVTTIPYSKLVLSDLNVRKYIPEGRVTAIAVSLAEHGQLNPLIVSPVTPKKTKYAVHAGGLRWRSFGRLIEAGRFPRTIPWR